MIYIFGKYNWLTWNEFWQINARLIIFYNNLKQLTYSTIRENWRSPRLIFERKRWLTEFTVSSKRGGPPKWPGSFCVFSANDRRPRHHLRCLPLLHRPRGETRRTRRTRYETRRDTEPKPESGTRPGHFGALPEEEERRERVGRHKRAHALRLHRGIRRLGSWRDSRGSSLLSAMDLEERSGICKIFPDPSGLFSSINMFLEISHVSSFLRIWNIIMISAIIFYRNVNKIANKK